MTNVEGRPKPRNPKRCVKLSPKAFRKFGSECPGGTTENSPALQRWDGCHTRTSPEGTAERWRDPIHVQPSLRDSNSSDVLPGVETPGYSRVVPPGRWFAIRPGNFRKAFGTWALGFFQVPWIRASCVIRHLSFDHLNCALARNPNCTH